MKCQIGFMVPKIPGFYTERILGKTNQSMMVWHKGPQTEGFSGRPGDWMDTSRAALCWLRECVKKCWIHFINIVPFEGLNYKCSGYTYKMDNIKCV